MNELEKTEADKLRQDIEQRKIKAFDYLRYLERASAQELITMGYRNVTNAEAMRKFYNNEQVIIEKMIQAYEKKYPIKG